MDFRASGVRSLKLYIFLILKEVKTNLILRSASQKRLSNCRSFVLFCYVLFCFENKNKMNLLPVQ